MKNLVRILTVLAMVALLASSASAPSAHRAMPPRTVAASFDATWAALIDVFADRQWPIQNMDKASGLITTGPMKIEESYADCGSAPLASTVGTYVSFNVRVKAAGTDTTVAVNATFKQEREFDGRRGVVDCTSRGLVELTVANEVDARASGEDEKRAKEQKKAKAASRFFCTSAPADETLALCAHSEAACAQRQQEIIAAAGDATPCTAAPNAICFQGKNASGTVVESCHPSMQACESRHNKTELLEPTTCK